MYQIIDNFLDKKQFSNIKNCFFPKNENDRKLTWFYNQGIVRNPELGPTEYDEYDWMYSHPFISSETELKSPDIDLIGPILKILKKEYAEEIIDARANLLVPTPYHIHHEDHVDRDTFHRVSLFYLTTNNGFTILKDFAKIDCIENRMVIFDGSIIHHSVSSTDNIRSVININYIPHQQSKRIFFNYE